VTNGVARVGCMAVALLAVRPTPAAAQVASAAPTAIPVGDWHIAPVAEARVRGEYRFDLDERDKYAVLERTRLGIDAGDGPVEARVVLQDARLLGLGDSPNPVGGPAPVAYVGAYEAWVDAHTDSKNATYLRAGRQAVTWGEGRLIGASDWSATGRSLDALRGRVALGDGGVELLGAVLTDPATPDSLHAYGELAGARFDWTFDPLLGVEAYALARVANDDPAASLGGSVRGRTYTAGARVHGAAHGWTYGAEGAYQFGHADDFDVERSAFAAAGHVSYQLENVIWQPTLAASGSYASGDKGGSTFTGFDPLLPDVHVWHGAMDLVSGSNEFDVGGSVRAAPWQDGEVSLGYRYLRLAQSAAAWTTGYLTAIGAAPGNPKAELGHEVDAVARWSPWAPLGLAAGYGLFALGDGARAVLSESGVGPLDAMTHVVRVPSLVHFAYAEITARLP
jgi:hypothetical protein